MSEAIIGLLHPGEMGAAIGRCLTAQGHTVLWASRGRSPATAERAAAAGLTDVGTAAELAGRAGIIFSVCPPHAALPVARGVAGFSGLFADANAIAPETARSVAAVLGADVTGTAETGTAETGTARFADGGIIGPPPQPGADPAAGNGTRLYLAGEPAAEVAALFAGTPVGARVVDGGVGAASAVKAAYAAWTKGSAALLLAARSLAHQERVEGTLLDEWALSQPELAGRLQRAAGSAAAKGWRWEGEMTEIAAAMAAAGLPDGFHLAAAEIFRRSPRREPTALAKTAPGDLVELVVEALREP
jgi:3-hydroxyisobutyrate dehydrogenase-like beta-hydroxyacid dehydrogenase